MRFVILVAVLGVMLIPIAAVGGQSKLAKDKPLTPHEAGQEDGDVTAQFQVPRSFATGDEGEVWLLDYLPSDRWTGATRVGFRVVLTDKARKEFQRIGVTDLGNHFRGRLVTVRGKVASVFYTGPGIQRGTLTIDALDQFVSVQ